MGSYLAIGYYEINSKSTSNMIVDLINELSSNYIKYDEKNLSYIIKRKGIASLLNYLLEIRENDNWIENYTYKNNIYQEYNGDKEKYYNNHISLNKKTLEHIIVIISELLCYMVLEEIKIIETNWY